MIRTSHGTATGWLVNGEARPKEAIGRSALLLLLLLDSMDLTNKGGSSSWIPVDFKAQMWPQVMSCNKKEHYFAHWLMPAAICHNHSTCQIEKRLCIFLMLSDTILKTLFGSCYFGAQKVNNDRTGMIKRERESVLIYIHFSNRFIFLIFKLVGHNVSFL